MLDASIQLMTVGMLWVFSFLILLYFFISVLSKIYGKHALAEEKAIAAEEAVKRAKKNKKNKKTGDVGAITAVISAAIQAHQSR